MDRRIKTFIRDLEKKCQENNVKLELHKGNEVKYDANLVCTGYFDVDSPGEENAILACALGDYSSIYVSTLVHESCHMDQWLEGAKIWENHTSCGVIDLWMDGNQIKNVKKHIKLVRDLELDCEKRTVKKIEEYDLPINIKEYTKKANAYIHLYNYIEITRKWSVEPYKNERVWKNLPDRFREKRYYNNLPKKIEKLFITNDPGYTSPNKRTT